MPPLSTPPPERCAFAAVYDQHGHLIVTQSSQFTLGYLWCLTCRGLCLMSTDVRPPPSGVIIQDGSPALQTPWAPSAAPPPVTVRLHASAGMEVESDGAQSLNWLPTWSCAISSRSLWPTSSILTTARASPNKCQWSLWRPSL
jgi:hypothetical protein